jgi:DNA adenine methylase
MIGPLAYIGGKRRLSKQIIALLPKHHTYVELFAGGAQVLFHKQPSKVEVINDLDSTVTGFFRVCQHHYQELLRYLEFVLVSRRWYELFAAQTPESLTDVQKAARFYFLQRSSFGGLVVKQHYHYAIAQRPNYKPERIAETIRAAHERLQGVQIECLPYEDMLRIFDRQSTLFYLDPPYWNRKLYRHNFTAEQFHDLERRLHDVKGRFVLSIDDREETRKLFGQWHIRPIELAYSGQPKAGKRYRELLISNVALTRADSPPDG